VTNWRHEWESDEPNPTCEGHAKRIPWRLNPVTGYYICGICNLANPWNLVLCDYCEEIWLPELASDRVGMNVATKELDHPDCAAARG